MSTEGIYLDSEIKLHHTSTESLLWQQVKRGFSNTEIRRDSIQYKGNYEFIYHIDQWQSDSLFLLGGNFSSDLYVDHRKKKNIVELRNFKFFPDSTFYMKKGVDRKDVSSMSNDFLRYKLHRISSDWE